MIEVRRHARRSMQVRKHRFYLAFAGLYTSYRPFPLSSLPSAELFPVPTQWGNGPLALLFAEEW